MTLNGATTSYGVYCYNTLDKLSISGLSATFQAPSSDTNSYGIYPTAASTELCLAGEFAMSGFSTDVFVQATEAIKIASSFSAKSSLAIEMILNTVANPSREYFAVYDGWAPTDNQLELISSYFVNSQGASAANVPKADAFGILFETDTSLASAKIGDEFYGTCLDACFHASTGDLIELTSQYDGSGLEITVGDQGQEITIDMKGATSSYLYFDNNATYTILNGTFNRGFNHSLSYSTNVYASAICAYSGSLILKQITAEVTDTSLTHYSLSYGIFSMCSDLSLVSSEISGVYCAVYSRNSGSVKVEDSSLAASSTVLNLGASNGVEITGSTITTPGLAVYQYSAALKITNSHISAEQGVNNLSTFATSVDTCVFDVSDYSFNFTYTTSTLALDGECGFSAPIAYSGVMNLGDNLSIAPGYGTAFYVTTSSGEGDAFAQAATSGTDISAYAGLFWANVSTNEAGIDTPEMEAMVSPVANSELWWAAEESCTVTHEGTTTVYYSFTKAIAALEEGDTLTLLRDVVTKASFTLSNSGTMDLNGHELEVVADGTAYTTQPYMAAQYANSVCAAVVCAASSFVLTDSSGTGAGTLRLSGDELTCGLAYSGSGELNISNVTIVATCTTSSTVTKFYGLMNTSGTLNLNSGASLEVYAQEQQSSASVALSSSLNSLQSALSADTTSIFAAQDVGALACAGIFQARNTSGEAGTTNVNSGASVSVVSSTTGSSAGSITNSNNNGSGGTGDMGTYYVREIHPAVGTTLYNEIYSMFSARATYSSGRYSLEKASLSDGTYIWAYSDLCTEGEEGACVPSTIYVTTTYTTPATAYGVYLQINTDGVINVSGSVQVISSTAEVAAVYADGTGKIAVDGASLAAATSFSTVRQNTGEKSLNSSAYLVEEVALSGYLITAPSSASTTVTLSGACSLNLVAEGGAGVTLPASSLLVDSSFMVAENSVDSSLSVRLPDGNVSGANFATAAKSTISAAQALYFTDADGLLGAGLTDDASHLVWSSGYTVRFLVITTGYTDAVEGADAWEEVAVYDDALYGQAVAVPSASTAQREGSLYYTYTFLGWATDPDATEVELEKTASYLTVTDSATYYAIYERTLIARTVKIQGAYDSDGNAIDTITMSQVKYCDSLGEALANHNVEMPQAQDYVSGDYTYRFVGWYFSADGTTGLYYDAASVEEYLIFNNSKSNYSVADTLTAKYVQVASGQTFVRFKVDYLICGYAASVGGQTDYSKAAGLSVYSAPSACVSETGYTRSFAGWKSGYYNTYEHWNTSSTHTADFTSNPLETIASSQDGDTITYTAVFNKSLTKCTVSVVYYAQNSSGTWVQTTKSLSYSYGTSGTVVAADIAELVGDGFTQSGVVYTFIGLGARSTDTYATWSLDSSADNFIPNVGYSTSFTSTAGNANETTSTTTTYYAIYSQAQQMVNVTFMAKDESGEYVVVATTSEAIAATTALNEVISGTYLTGSTSAKVSSLTNSTWTDTITDTDYYLTGWALEADASDSRSGNAVVMPNAGDTVTYYAVYGEAAKAYIRFYEDEDADEYFKSITVRTGTVLGAASNFPDAPAKEGYYFVGWMDYSTGVIIDPSTYVVSGNMSLIATYEEITFDLSGVCEGVEVDTSGLAIDSSGITLVAVAVNVVAESSVDRNLSAKYSSSTADSYYTVSIVLTTQDGEEVCVTSDFGTLGISFVPASAQELMRVWWLDVDEDCGCVSYTDQQDATTEEVVVATISSYNTSDYGANMAIAYEQTEAAKELAMAISNYMSQLDELYGTEFREADYTDEGWEELGLVYEAGLAAIKEATTLDEAYEATIAAIAAMEAVEKDLSTELALAKAEALVKLVNAYAKLDSSNYTKKEWKQVKQAYKAGRSAINAATTIASAISAANAAINAVNSIIPSASSSSTLSGSSTGSAVLASSSGSSSAVLSKSSTSSGAVKSSKSSDDEEEATEEESVEEEVAEEVSTELESSVEDEEALLGDESDEDEGSSVLDWIRDHLALTVGAGLALLAGLVALLLLLLGRKANEADQLDTAAIASTNTIEF